MPSRQATGGVKSKLQAVQSMQIVTTLHFIGILPCWLIEKKTSVPLSDSIESDNMSYKSSQLDRIKISLTLLNHYKS